MVPYYKLQAVKKRFLNFLISMYLLSHSSSVYEIYAHFNLYETRMYNYYFFHCDEHFRLLPPCEKCPTNNVWFDLKWYSQTWYILKLVHLESLRAVSQRKNALWCTHTCSTHERESGRHAHTFLCCLKTFWENISLLLHRSGQSLLNQWACLTSGGVPVVVEKLGALCFSGPG